MLDRSTAVVPGLVVHERDVARHIDEAEARAIRSTPTVTIDDRNGAEVFRAEGIPTLDQVLVAIAKAV